MMELVLASSHSLVEDMRTIEEGPSQVERHEDMMGGMYLLVNMLLQESLSQSGSLNPAGNVDEVSESQDDKFEEGEIKEAFRAEEYDGIYLELGLLLSCKMRLRDASDRAQRMLQRYLVRDGHLFIRREVGNPRRVVCGRNRQIDVIAALHDGIAGGHRGVQTTYAKISDMYYLDGMMAMIRKFCRSCVPCQERSRLRQGKSLHPRLERGLGAVVHLNLLFMPLGDQGYNYIFDARDNLSRSDFTKTVMPRGGKGTRPPRRPLGASGGYEWHGPRHRESTPEYDGDDIELFLDSFWEHARLEFHRFTEGGLRRSLAHTQEEPPASEGPLRELEAHLDISQWGASPWGEEHGEQAEEMPREEVPREEVPQEEVPREEVPREEVPQEEVPREGVPREEVPQEEVPREGVPQEEVPQEEVPREGMPREEVQDTQRERGLGDEGRRAGKEVIEVEEDTPPQTPTTAEEKRARRTRKIEEIWQERQRLEAAGALPGQPPSEPAKAPEIPETWRDFWEQRGEELPSPIRVGFGIARKAEERLDRKIKFLAKTTFNRHLLLESDLAGKKTKEEGHGVRLEAMEVEIQELRALVASQATIIESLRKQTQGKVDKPESSRQGEQRRPGQGLSGQPSAAEPRREPPMGRVILEPEEARAQREAERKAFEFRAPTELATLPVAAADPVVPLAVEEGLPPSSSEPAQSSAEGSMSVLLEALYTMQEEASLFSPEQRIEESLEREMGIEVEGVIEGGLQRLGTPEYEPEEIEEQPMVVPGEMLERRPQRLDAPECVPATG
ncbi:hypothetical protein CBR_g51825 [Chara braunii]|uniref:Integrase zinc-binding domain-containing protein n=1 Tax=Chara braunii TaxID=69332 RepID=A0A388M950_CHABU|nr:hypothetical protein CBR_g51825 [Chara braunii]|eukprot:GBG91091.1 hypothetical protein CBR_g51825 [Chara braunii]